MTKRKLAKFLKHLARNGWNIISESYQMKTRISLEDVHYGPISAGESELKLLGTVRGKDVLEIGCGGGQNAIVLSKWGARSVGLDISEKQIEHARRLAKREGARVPFHLGDMQDLHIFEDKSFDTVLSSFGIGYADNVLAVFCEVFRVLRKHGLFVFAATHPIIGTGRPVRYGGGRRWAVSNYFNRRKRVWKWRTKDGAAEFYGGQITIQDYFDMLTKARFTVERVLEPEPYPVNEMTESQLTRIPYWDPGYVKNYGLWRKVPFTIIFKAKKDNKGNR
jgi:ubiquinone/menaquinone biosynthesis C-methylase UbiE